MEKLLHYVWKHRMFPLSPLRTSCGEAVEVIDPGLANTNAGPDFFNAKLKIGGTLWVGNVEIHDKSGDWYAHGHDNDPAYDNVVLHVARLVDVPVVTSGGRTVPQMQLEVPPPVLSNYKVLLSADRYPPCHKIVPSLSRMMMHGWTGCLQAERLERKTQDIMRRVELCGGSWEDALFVTMARNYGFGINGEAFEAWARAVPLSCAAHHRDDIFQIEALFMGQAGLLDPAALPPRYAGEAHREGYFDRLRTEYLYLAHKFSLRPIDPGLWRFLRLRPRNFPHIRISQLATLYCSRRSDLSRLAGCTTAEQLRTMLASHVTPYWETHYSFGNPCKRSPKAISGSSLDLLIINTAVPMLFAYGRHRRDESLCSRAVSLLEELKPEDNSIVRLWKECGMDVASAADSQALIQLKNEYCDRKECLRCRIGYEYLRRGDSFRS